ncbi:unnamed protein product [Mytilus edulis]|uniref:CUB domain-containing protein n=1 Tax=Mytilus edulis TaxID=6550 RepID=A0A8S3R7C9_MYTED|nr:unnamed protein product [Mytilus edulis]
MKNCNGINFQKDFLKCELLSDLNVTSQFVSAPGYSYSDISDWKMKEDSCWPNNPCSEITRCIPSKSNDHVCLKYIVYETFLKNISSPGFPNKYEHKMNETWKIEAGIGNKVALRFTHFDLESCCDYVKVYECDVDSNRLLGSFTGEELPPEVRSIGNCIAIIMTTDGSVYKAGFSANIYKITS